MSKIKYAKANGMKLLKKSHRLKRFGTGLFLVACLLFTVFVAYAFSGLLTVNVSVFPWKKSSAVSLPKTQYYAVVMESFDAAEPAQLQAEFYAMQGASGVVWEKNKKYLIIGNIYALETHARQVCEGINEKGGAAVVQSLSFPKISLSLSALESQQKKVLQTALDFLKELPKKLYDFSINLETKSLTPLTVSSSVNDLKGECILLGNKLDLLHSTHLTEEGLIIKNNIIKTNELLNELMLKLLNSDSAPHISKHAYVKYLQFYENMLINLQKY